MLAAATRAVAAMSAGYVLQYALKDFELKIVANNNEDKS